MDFKEKTKQHIKSTGKLEKRRHRPIDWLGLTVFVSAALVASVFVFGSIANFVDSELFFAELNNNATYNLEYKWNMEHNGSTPEKTYEELRQALLNNDLEDSLGTFHSAYRSKYEDNLAAAYNDGNLSVFLDRLTPLKSKISGDDFSAVYSIEPIPGNNSLNPLDGFSEAVEFTRDGMAVWKISSI